MGIVQRDSTKMVIWSYVGAAIGYFNKILLFPNFLTPDQVGLSNILISIAAIYAQFSSFGIVNITLRFFPYYKNKALKHHGFLFWSLLFVVIGFIAATILFLLFKNPFINYYSKNSPLLTEYYFYLIPLGFSTLLFSLLDTYLRSLYKNVVPVFITEVVTRIFVSISIIIYIFKWVAFPSFVLIYVALNCSTTLILLLYIGYIRQFFIKPVKTNINKRLYKYIFTYGLVSFVSNVSNVLLINIDVLMVAGLISLYQTGIYTTTFFITTIMVLPYRAILRVTTPIVAEHWKNRDIAQLSKLYKQVSLVSYIVAVLFFICIWVNLKNIFSFMPSIYSTGILVFLFIGLGRIFDMATGLNGVILVLSKKYRYDLLFTLFLIALAVSTNYWLIPIFGMTGAALSTMITLFSYNALRLLFVWVVFKIHPFNINFIWITLIGLVALAIGYYFPFVLNKYADIVIRSIITSSVFVIPCLYFNVSEDLNSFVKKLQIAVKDKF